METSDKLPAIEPLQGLERQKAFLDSMGKEEKESSSFFITEKVMEGMRDSGYRDIRKAINDLIDNSEQAGAKKIAILTTAEREDKKNARERISNIAVIDDGHGMYPDMLEIAVKWGGTDRHNQRDGLGRFGFGLPTASISVTRTYEVYSKVEGEEWHRVRVDLQEIANNAMTNGGHVSSTPKSIKATLPDFVKEYIKTIWKKEDLDHGTIVLLINPDRIRNFALPKTFEAKMLQNIGLVYRHFMPATNFFVNNIKVEMIDPLFLNPNGIGYDAGNGLLAEGLDDMIIQVKNKLIDDQITESYIKLRFSFMPPRFQRTKDYKEIPTRLHVMKENNGYFIVCRAGRQIDVVRDTNYQSDRDNITLVNYDWNWAIELNFGPELDELFGITTNKQQVEINSYLWDIFKEHKLPAIIKGFRSKLQDIITENESKEEDKKDIRDSEHIMGDAEKYDKVKVPKDKKDRAKKKVREKAEEIAEAENEDVDKVEEKLTAETEKKRFKIEFTHSPGALFYDVEIWGSQVKIKINSAHRFYTDIYSQQNQRGKTAIELLLFVLGTCEVESDGEKQFFYGNEKYEWSKKLELRLKLLDQQNSILDKNSLEEEIG